MPRVLNIDRLDYKVTPGAVYIGRAMPQYGLPGSKWCNPFEIDKYDRVEVINKFKLWLYATPEGRARLIAEYTLSAGYVADLNGPLINYIHELRGRDLVCWCAPEPCHGDVLLQLANE